MPPRQEEANQRLKDERREEILRAALRIFARRGLAAARISDIAAAAGLSYGLVYHYFKDKEALFIELITRAVRGGAYVTEQALAAEGSALERLHMLCEEMMEGVRDDPEYTLLVIQATSLESLPEAARETIGRYSAQTYENVARLIRQGQEAGQIIAADPVELVEVYFAVIQGLALNTYDMRDNTIFPTTFPSPGTVMRLFQAREEAGEER